MAIIPSPLLKEHTNCRACDPHYLSSNAQSGGVKYTAQLSDSDAAPEIKSIITEIRLVKNALCCKVRLYGDAILARWSRATSEKRRTIIQEQAAYTIGPFDDEAGDAWPSIQTGRPIIHP